MQMMDEEVKAKARNAEWHYKKMYKIYKKVVCSYLKKG